MFLKSQLARYAGGLPLYAQPALSGVPYVPPDFQSGDTVDFVVAPLVSAVYPPPTTTNTVFANGTSRGATPYTVTDADVTAGNLTLLQHTANTRGFSEATSASINPVAVQTAVGQGLLGGNTSGTTHYTVQQYLNNAGQAVRQPFYAFNSTTTNYSGSFDANGWPTSAFSALISAEVGGRDGQLPAGTYNCSIRSVGQAASITALQSCTVSGTTLDADGVTTHFTVVIPFDANPMLSFSAGVQYLDIPRDRVTPTYGGPEFWPTNLAFWAQKNVVRLMDLCNCTGAETTATQRNAAFPELGSAQPATTYSLTRVARWIKAVVQYAGSSVKTVIFNPPGLLDPTVTQSDNLAYQIPTMLNTVLSGVSVQLLIELGDEPWNASLGAALIYSGNLHTAETETKCLPYYPGETSHISSIVGNGDGTVTVNTSSPVSAIPLPDGSTFAITAGMSLVVNHQQLNTTWGAGSITPYTGVAADGNPSYAADGTVTSAVGGVLSVTTNSFTYKANGSPSGALAATSGSNQMAFFFGLTSNLIKDGISLNLFDIGNKVQVRRTYLCQQVWSAVRPQDKFVLNLQQYGSTFAAAMTGSKFAYGYARYLGGGSDSWFYGGMVAPYVKPVGIPFTGVATAGGTTITGVAWAASAQVGDQIKIAGAAAVQIATISWSANTVTVQTTYPHGISGTVTATMSGQVPSAYAGSFSCTAVDSTHFTFPLASNPGAATTLGTFVPPTGSTLTTTVVAGSSGTTLNIAGTITATVNAGTIDYVYGPSTSVAATIDGTSGVMTVLAGSGLMVGMMGNGTPVTMAFNSRIASQLTGTAGGVGTYQLSLPQKTISPLVVTAISWSASTVTVTTASSHGIGVGQSVIGVMQGQAPSAYAGTYTFTGVNGTQFTFPLASNPGAATTLGTCIGPVAFAQTDGLVNAMLAAVPNFGLTLAGHIFTNMRWGKRPIVYEGGPDTQNFANQQVAIHTNAAMGPVYTALLDAWFNQGGQEFLAYTGAPAVFINAAQGEWSALQAYSDTSSPKHAALTAYAPRALAFADIYQPGLVFGPSGTAGSYVKGISQSETGWQGFYSTGMVGCAGGSTRRSLEVLRNLPRGRRYSIKVTGSDSVAGTTGDIYIDGVLKGTVTLPNNGSGASVATTPGDSTVLQLGELTRGAHRVMVDFPAGRGANVGVFSITLATY